MGKKTKIDWCDSSINPVTGCLHGCEYCYARGIATRFDGKADRKPYPHVKGEPERFDLEWPVRREGRILAYPFGFAPTFHRYRLDEIQKWKGPRTIFVCSMADLFGEWVPEEWIEAVFEACQAAPQHRYLFLTKNPKRYLELAGGIMPYGDNFWYGSSVTSPDMDRFGYNNYHTFVSIEPILEPMGEKAHFIARDQDWIIIGAETGNRNGKVIPERAWIDEIVEQARKYDKPVFMKETLRDLMGSDFVQEYPWRNGV